MIRVSTETNTWEIFTGTVWLNTFVPHTEQFGCGQARAMNWPDLQEAYERLYQVGKYLPEDLRVRETP